MKVPKSADELRQLTDAAMDNARELLTEAELLNNAGHYARGYFLGVAALEEVGKALIAFNARGRNLNNQKVAARIKGNLLEHKAKVIAAFTGAIGIAEKDRLEATINVAMELISTIRHGREPSMYTALHQDGTIQRPSAVVRPVAAQNLVRLAGDCLQGALEFMRTHSPNTTSEASDHFFTMKPERVRSIMHEPEFSPFYLARIHQGNVALEEAIFEYERAKPKPSKVK
jgi:AbiV family abortive infection protein